MVTLYVALRFPRWLIFFFTYVIRFLSVIVPSLLTAPCRVGCFALFFLTCPFTFFFVILSALFTWSVLLLLLVCLLGICYGFSSLCKVLHLSLCLQLRCVTSPIRCSSWYPWPLHAVLVSCRRSLRQCLIREMICFSRISLSFGLSLNLRLALFLAPFGSGLCVTLSVLFLWNSFCVPFGLKFTCLILPLFPLSLVLCFSLLAILLILFLKLPLVSSFGLYLFGFFFCSFLSSFFSFVFFFFAVFLFCFFLSGTWCSRGGGFLGVLIFLRF